MAQTKYEKKLALRKGDTDTKKFRRTACSSSPEHIQKVITEPSLHPESGSS